MLLLGPNVLPSFSGYSIGLEAMDRVDYGAAARHFRSAAQADPSFQAAREGQQTATAAPAAERATGGGIVTMLDAVERATGVAEPTSLGSATGLLSAGARDVVPAIGDAIG